jgi:hypothetical protein
VALIVIGVLVWLSVPLRGTGPGWALQSNRQGGFDYVLVEQPTGFDLGEGVSAEMWVKPSSLSLGGIHQLFIAVRRNPAVILLLFLEEVENPAWGLGVYRAGSGGPIIVRSTEAGAPKAGEWQHLAATFDGTTVVLYRNGKPVTGQAQAAGVDAAEMLESLGAQDDTLSAVAIGLDAFAFAVPDGIVDEVRLWNGVRTRGQIQADKSRNLEGQEPGLVAYYRLDEDREQTAIDSSIRGNDGQLGRLPEPDPGDPTWIESGAPLWNRPFRLWPLLVAVGVLVLVVGGLAGYLVWLRRPRN